MKNEKTAKKKATLKHENTALNKIILIGGSAGGFNIVSHILGGIDKDIPAAIIVVLHMSDNITESLIHRFSKSCALPVSFANDGDTIKSGRVYVAPPRFHCMIENKRIRLTKGPRVNRARPSIDLTFRSAAVEFNSKAIGILVSGMLDDGVTGLRALKSCGGVTIVQDPAEAEYPDLPSNALNKVEPKYTVSSKDIAGLIQEQVLLPNSPDVPVPYAIQLENELDLNNSDDISKMERLGHQTSYTCTDCGGSLWEVREDEKKESHYRCHVGHVLSRQELLNGKDEHLEQALWVAYRTLEEKLRMLEEIARNEEASGRPALSALYKTQAEETKVHVENVRKFLYTINESMLN